MQLGLPDWSLGALGGGLLGAAGAQHTGGKGFGMGLGLPPGVGVGGLLGGAWAHLVGLTLGGHIYSAGWLGSLCVGTSTRQVGWAHFAWAHLFGRLVGLTLRGHIYSAQCLGCEGPNALAQVLSRPP